MGSRDPHKGGSGLVWDMVENFLRKGLLNLALKGKKESMR